MIQREADVKSKVTAVALTDSVHNVWHQEAGKTIREWMREVRLGFSNAEMNEREPLYPDPPPTYITSNPQMPFLEAEHWEGIEKKLDIFEIIRENPSEEQILWKPSSLFWFAIDYYICTQYTVGALAEEGHDLLRGY